MELQQFSGIQHGSRLDQNIVSGIQQNVTGRVDRYSTVNRDVIAGCQRFRRVNCDVANRVDVRSHSDGAFGLQIHFGTCRESRAHDFQVAGVVNIRMSGG